MLLQPAQAAAEWTCMVPPCCPAQCGLDRPHVLMHAAFFLCMATALAPHPHPSYSPTIPRFGVAEALPHTSLCPAMIPRCVTAAPPCPFFLPHDPKGSSG
eukprot:24455-Chlamydomonas_euryale.AAC.1